MISLVVFASICVSVLAGGQEVAVTQDTLGNYNFKYAIDGISRVEHGDLHGNVNGGFSYIDPYGILRKTEFTSGVHGYNAIGTDIPVPVQDTPEVAHAKAKHLAALYAAYLVPKIPEFQGPEENFITQIPVENSFVAPIGRFEQLVPAAVHFAPAPVHFAPAPLHFAPAPVHFGGHHIPALPSFSHVGISETPEVLAARAEHFAAHAAALKTHFHH
ncbi:hypothetical protein RN001_002562 [Aquatica leii]|uniref:Uncharacterized protein n=1 Tax=Aquatica leii TaxID=1421715 RepID=A0AAN7SDD4_9COLE|nr:hypothetical protein RN001_002562 [Aquatica leii]